LKEGGPRLRNEDGRAWRSTRELGNSVSRIRSGESRGARSRLLGQRIFGAVEQQMCEIKLATDVAVSWKTNILVEVHIRALDGSIVTQIIYRMGNYRWGLERPPASEGGRYNGV